MTAVAEAKERIELRQDLLVRLGPGNAPVELDDVAKFTVEGTATRELNADVSVVLRLEEIKAGNWSRCHVRRVLLRFDQRA
jgi:hypothetical protein